MDTEKLTSAEKLEAARELAKALVRNEVAQVLIDRPNLFWVAKEDRWFEYDRSIDDWNVLTDKGLRTTDKRLENPDGKAEVKIDVLRDICREGGRGKRLRGFSFSLEVRPEEELDNAHDPRLPAHVLNEHRRDCWLEPEELKDPSALDDYKLFDVLMRNLAGNDPEREEHLYHVVGWKYLHPEDNNIPCLNFYGAGNAGKNLFASVILARIFGPKSVTTIGFSQIEKYNGPVAKKLVVHIDEAAEDKLDANTIKRIVGAPVISVEHKYMNPYDAPNTALYIISTNNAQGGIRLEDLGTARRWSLMPVTRSLFEALARYHWKVPEGHALTTEQQDDIRSVAKPLINEVILDNAIIRHFLWKAVQTALKLDCCPSAELGDYKRLKATQSPVIHDLLHEAFIDDPKFIVMPRSALYSMYKMRSQTSNPSAKVLGEQNFVTKALEWLKDEGLDHDISYTVKLRYCSKQNAAFHRTSATVKELSDAVVTHYSEGWRWEGSTYVREDEADPAARFKAKVAKLRGDVGL